MNSSKNLPDNSDIRRRAEKELESLPKEPENIAKMSPKEMERVIHELQVHQIELKMQNEELRSIQNDLEAARNRYSHLFNFAPVGYITIDEKGIIIEANLTFCTMLGIDRSQLIGKDFTRFIPKNDQDIFYLLQQRLFESQTQQACELRLTKTEEEEFFIYLECMLLIDGSSDARWIRATINDITDQKKAKEDLKLSRDLINQSNDAIYVIDAHTGNLLDANEKACLDLNYTRDELLKLTISDIDHDMADPMEWIKFGMLIRKNEFYLAETEHNRSDDTKFPVEVNSKFIQHGEKEFIVMAARDILERQAMESQLRHMQKMNALGTMAGGMAHEFNNLLQLISGNAELISGLIGDENQKNLKGIFTAINQGARLVRQMLSFSRKSEVEFQTTNLNRLIEKFKMMLDRLLPPNIQIILDLQENLYSLHTDHGQMEQVLLNLCINAKDAMQNGGKLTIQTENITINESFQKKYPRMKQGKCVLMTITDTGYGMDKKTLEKIFDPFFTTKEVGKGTGLGLSVVYGIIKNHFGTISCSSNPGFGTAFNIFLPAEVTESDTEAITEISSPVVLGTEKILVVEDDRDISSMTRQMLECFNYSVLTANSGESASYIYAKKKAEIDLIMLDLGMPGMGGIKCLEWLIEFDPDVNVIMASGYSEDHLKKIAEKYGAKGYITKPYNLAQISKLIRSVLDKKE